MKPLQGRPQPFLSHRAPKPLSSLYQQTNLTLSFHFKRSAKPEHPNGKPADKSQKPLFSFGFLFIYRCCDSIRCVSFRFEYGPSEHCQGSPKCTVPSPRRCRAHASRSLSPRFSANFGCVAGSSFNSFSAPSIRFVSFGFRFLSLFAARRFDFH